MQSLSTTNPFPWIAAWLPKKYTVPHFSMPIDWLLGSYVWKIGESRYHQSSERIEEEYALVAKAQQDPKHFGPIYERYYDQIFIFVDRRLDDEEATADVTSTIFMQCLANIGKFSFQGVPFSAWLYRIAVNEINQFFRKKQRHPRAVSIQDAHIGLLFEEMEAHPKDPKLLIARLLQLISADDIQFLELRFFEGRSFREMGYLLGLTEVNAKIKTYRILDKLKAHAKKLGESLEQ